MMLPRPISRISTFIALPMLCIASVVNAQHGDKPRPEAWNDLVHGGRFMDRILPAPIYKGLETDTWGTDAVKPRDIHNGIEDPEWSYWGGRPILESDGKYHLFVARWREDNPRGAWRMAGFGDRSGRLRQANRTVCREQVLGPGHFPEIHRLQDDEYVIYHFHGCYTAGSLEGPWKHLTKRRTRLPGSHIRFVGRARRRCSLVMLDRIMRVWIKENGSDKFQMVSGRPVQPAEIPGRYEDPMVWRTEVQYHTIVNDWYGRTAYHFRSKDGVNWTMDPGEAYTIDFDGYEDGTKVGWYKYERPKVLQDQYGRATHLYLAVIDVPKKQDLSKDNHSSKNIVLPLVVGRRLRILDNEKITADTETIRLRIPAESGFDPHVEVEVESLRFGAPEEVDFGRGCKAIGSEKDGKDLVVTFDAAGHGITERTLPPKLLGKTRGGKLLFGYSRLPEVDYSPYVIKR